MNSGPRIPLGHFGKCILAFVGAIHLSVAAIDAGQPEAPVNAFGVVVRDAAGSPVNYSRSDLTKMESESLVRNAASPEIADSPTAPQGFIPSAPGGAAPFWQYAIFGSGIGASNIVVAPAAGGLPPQIIIGGNSKNDFGGDDFWQVIQRSSTTGNYDQLFVSPIYSAVIKRIALGNVTGDSQPEIVVMLADGRIYLYDFATKAELGYISTGLTGLEGLSVTDLNGDGVAELIVTTANDLFVFSGNGVLLWQLAGAGGLDVVAGQMDLDPAIEIATTKGVVTDSVTHTAQWTRSGGFGARLKLAPIAGASYQQLIAADAWYTVYAYDVATQLPRWSISTPQDIGAIQVADVDNDGVPELLIGDGQWGKVRVYDLNTQAKKWEANNPEHGVTNIAVADVDNDGVPDLIWGAGWSSTGADFFYVASTTDAHAIKWQNVYLEGPFLGPVIGDLDGDGKAELVICTGSAGGRILVFDLATGAFRGISPVSTSVLGPRDIKLRDLEGDGRAEIVLATDHFYDGAIEVYSFDTSNTFTLKWTNPTRPAGSPFSFVDVADLDGNGTSEIIAGNSVYTSGSEGVFVYIFDYPSTSTPWRSVKMAGSNSMTGLVVADLDGNGSKDIAALVSNGDL